MDLSKIEGLDFLTNGVSKRKVVDEFGEPVFSKSIGSTNWTDFFFRARHPQHPQIAGVSIGFNNNLAFSIRPIVNDFNAIADSFGKSLSHTLIQSNVPTIAFRTIELNGDSLVLKPDSIIADNSITNSGLVFSVTAVLPQSDVVRIRTFTEKHLHEDVEVLFDGTKVSTNRTHEVIATNRIELRFKNGVPLKTIKGDR